MNWITFILAATLGGCVLMAFIHLNVWLSDRRSWANLGFFAAACGTIGIAIGEMFIVNTDSTEVFGGAIRWFHPAYALGVIGSLTFVHFSFGTGRRWLLVLAIGLRVLAQVPNFTTGVNMQFIAILNLQKVSFLGEQVTVLGDCVPNPWLSLGVLASLVQLGYIIDASVRSWRTGTPEARRRAVVLGGSLASFIVLAVGYVALLVSGALRTPFITSVPFFGVLLAMSFELSREVLSAAQRGRDLRVRDQQLMLATEATNLGFWSRDLVRNEFWANAKWRGLLGLAPSEHLNLERFLHHVQRDDREAVRQAMTTVGPGGDLEAEFRVVQPDGSIRWINSRGRIEADAKGQPVLMRGVSFDITLRKQAEEAAHNLTGRLINAQEEERKRLARELHDDLSQSLALLSMDLELSGQKPLSTRPEELSTGMEALSARVRGLSSVVHRLSHELHPAKLEQLGLAAALRGFCREMSAAHQLAIHFTAGDLPRVLPDGVVLCLYRVVQESLQNVVKHSGATSAHVTLTGTENELHLVVNDDGTGFDAQAAQGNGSLGLVSMRERVRLVRGRFTLESRKGRGTRIEVFAPLPPVIMKCGHNPA